MVAFYSAPACPVGSNLRVRFKRAVDAYYASTNLKACNGVNSMNFSIAGMYGNSTYEIKSDVLSGPRITTGPSVSFTTGTPSYSDLPTLTKMQAAQPPSSLTDSILYTVTLELPLGLTAPYVTDLNGNLLWYLLDRVDTGLRVTPGGNTVAAFGIGPILESSGMREYDLQSRVVKETNVARLNQQLAMRGLTPMPRLHHDVGRVANGDYLMLGMTERFNTVQGAGVDVLGDYIIVLDPDLQIKWVWDAFAKLEVLRKAVDNDTCTSGFAGCLLIAGSVANDWTHANSVAPTPDGNLILSARHQDFIYKINYANGTGNGDVIWKLGKDGDFTYLNAGSDPWSWKSHQHDAEYDLGSTTTISLLDNGNMRQAQNGGNSRGQVLTLNEANRTATFVLNADLGAFCFAISSAQRLSTGTYAFDCGWVPDQTSRVLEYMPSGSQVSRLDLSVPTYRNFRYRDLYSAPF